MKKKLLLWAALVPLSVLLLTPRDAHAQKTYALGFGGGAAIPVGKLSDTQKTGYNAMAVLAIGVSDLPIGIRLDALYNNLSHPQVAPTAGGTTSDLRVVAALGNLVFAFPGTSAKAYIIAGGGLYSAKADVPGARAQSSFGVNGGLGATFGFGPFATFFESRYHSISRSVSKGGVYQFVPITFGVLF
jgi:hypothetical protein